ncbi:unnamed protein product [Calypogeia fissa]
MKGQDGMEIPRSERPETGGSGSRDGDGITEEAGQEGELLRQAGAVVQGVEEKKPLNIENVDSSWAGVSSNRNNVDTNLNNSAGTSSSSQNVVSDVGSSSPKVGTTEEVAIRIDSDYSNSRLDERRSGAEGGVSGSDDNTQEGDPLRQQQEASDPSLLEVGTAAEAAGADTTAAKQFRTSSTTFGVAPPFPFTDKSSEAHLIDIPLKMSSKVEELDSFKRFTVARTLSNFSRASVESGTGDQCRICQQHTEESLMELGCQCRGELAKAHLSCVNHWFGNKGTNKCEVCQHVATNVPLPASQPTPHFWVWRVGGPYNSSTRRGQGVGLFRLNPLPMRPVLLMTLRRHPMILLLWVLLFAFMAYLFVDVTDSASIGYAAMPIGFLFGVLVVLGLGTAARLVLECWHERAVRRNIRRMEEEPNLEDFLPVQNNIEIHVDPAEGRESSDVPPPSPGGPVVQGSAEASVTASVAASATPDVLSR